MVLLVLILLKDGLNPDLVLIDFLMPNMSGIEFLQEVNKLENSKDLKVCMLSAKNSLKDVDEAFKYGACTYIIKTIDPYIILEKIRNIIQEKRKRKIISILVS